MNIQWTKEQANAWYAKLPWLRGCNFIGSDCVNRFDMWQSYKAEQKLATAERELALSENVGFNTVRLWVIFEAWLNEPEFFMDMLEKYITICAQHNQYVMLCLTNEEDLPRGAYEDFVPRAVGEQAYALGYHQGRFPETPEVAALPRWHYAQNPRLAPDFWRMITNIVTRYANDSRVLCWNIYNEPGNALGEACVPILEKMFEVVRACNPMQPVTADVWRGLKEDDMVRSKEEEVALMNSDVISFHSYSSFSWFCQTLDQFRTYGRPLFCTEWLNRVNHNEVHDIYPLLYITNVANYCWGLVLGKTQTNEPWEWFWEQYEDSDKQVDFDFTKWQHDLYRPNIRPYDPKETELIQRYNKLADMRCNSKEDR